MGSGESKYNVSKVQGTQAHEGDYVEEVVCMSSDIKDNEMKSFEVAGNKVLVVKQKCELFALSNKCSHYGAPLSSGVLGEGHVRCPWHGACFNIRTGDIEEYPGLDSLPCYEVFVNAKKEVVVKAKRDDLKSGKRMKKMVSRDLKNDDTFVIIGGGAAGASCLETLRQEGFNGRLVVISTDRYRPYDRTKLSKLLDSGIDKLALRPDGFYHEHGVEVMLSTEVTGIDIQHKQIRMGSKTLNYTKVFLATGSVPRRPPIPGNSLGNVFVLRNVDDANAIANTIGPEKDVVVLGGSFIGMEAAAYCANKARSVTVIIRDSVPFKASLGELVGGRLMKLAEENGVKFLSGDGLTELRPGSDGKSVGSAITQSGSELPADVVIFGIGVSPSTEFLRGSGVDIAPSGNVPVDEMLSTNVEGIFAGGDIALAPVIGGERASIGHWQLAQHHGALAARNMLGAGKPLSTVPYFWTMLFGKGLRYAGYAPGFEDVLITGDLEALSFVAYYLKGDNVLAIATMGRDPLAAKFADRLAAGKTLDRAKAEGDSWVR